MSSRDPRHYDPEEFDRGAQRNANAFWLWGIIAVAVLLFAEWWALIPTAVALWYAAASVACTRRARKLRQP